ncbi:gamma-glutamylcyclotransferase [Paenibacillus sp. N3.4]|uniref:gamma-glutamylcyclotransferase family protein n=1 Tax=Paenibacillus sp. N3.4 TaxID=2603222 RepID=UPI0011CC31E8|nr:gamma-glutamylcyclotransferase [Paenibacillus sp. N3.4]TXK85306.1 hypothetical protein FU659_04840 [Paenibacillus sp. N3.4]
MYLFTYGTMALNNPLVAKDLKLISSDCWVRGILCDTGLGFPALVEGENKVRGKLVLIESEDVLKVILGIADSLNDLNPSHVFSLKPITVHTDNSSYEAEAFMYNHSNGLETIDSGTWI